MFTVGAVIDSGRASAGAAATLTDASKLWGTNVLAGFLVTITGGTGVGQIHQIASNTTTVLTVSPNWTTAPSTDSVYEILLASNVTLVAGDIEIGAVELKDATTDARAPVSATNGVAVYLPAATVLALTPPTPVTAAAIAAAQWTGGYSVKTIAVNAVTGTAQDLIPLVALKSIQVVGGHLSFAGAAGALTILNGAAVLDYLNPSIGSMLPIIPRSVLRPIWTTAAGVALKVTTQTSQTVSGMLEYIEV